MSLLSVTVKKARYTGGQGIQFNTYVTLKLQNVKSTTVTVKGPNPSWNQDFLFETNDVNTGLLMEVWNKGMLWDRALGYHWLPLPAVHYSNEEGPGEWVSLDAELVMMDGEVVGTKEATGHSLLVDCRFELPFDAENTEAADLQRKLELLNSIVDQEAKAEQARRQMQYFGHSGYSEDSDYTSDLNYPVGQHANSSASQFRSAAHQIPTPQRSLETSRENSYETDEPPPQQHHPHHHGHHLSPGQPMHTRRRGHRDDDYYGERGGDSSRYIESDQEPLYYNSRPRNHKESYSQSAWYDEYGPDAKYDQHASCPRIYQDSTTRYYQPRTASVKRKEVNKNRRPSLERQTTLYDDQYYMDTYYDAGDQPYSQDNRIYDTSVSYGTDYYNYSGPHYKYQEDRYGQEEEDRQWDSGGGMRYNKGTTLKEQYENQMNIKYSSRSSLQKYHRSSDQDSVYYTPRQSYEEEDYHSASEYVGTTARRKQPVINRHSSRHSLRDVSDFPPGYRPRKTDKPKLLPQIPTRIKPSPSLPPTPARQKPQVPTRRAGSLEHQESSMDERYGQFSNSETRLEGSSYNEDYNYAYMSTDNLITQEAIETQEEMLKRTNAMLAQHQEQMLELQSQYHHNQQTYQDDYYYQHDSIERMDGSMTESTLVRRDTVKKQPETKKDSGAKSDSVGHTMIGSLETAVTSLSSSVFKRFTSAIGGGEQGKTNKIQTQAVIETKAPPPAPVVNVPSNGTFHKEISRASNDYQEEERRYEEQNEMYGTDETYEQEENFEENQRYDDSQDRYGETDDYYEDETDRGFLSKQNSIEKGYIQKQDSIKKGYPTKQDSIDGDYMETNGRGYLHAQESVDSYVDEEIVQDDYSRDSPVSVVERYEPDQEREIAETPYKQASPPGAKTSPTVTSPTLRHQDSIDEDEVPGNRAHIREYGHHHDSIEEESQDKQKSVSFEEEELPVLDIEVEPQIRPTVTQERRRKTPRERWHWAYNKIVHELNVSTHDILFKLIAIAKDKIKFRLTLK
ncbi:uncharacterized protein LOC106668030 isoform X2 [Cimex lectularius]|uniref:C2 domain-containing protein n=1 Tax=Cimex lectularius TaxID=79782 RepID=A0A8I6RV27_CIMLE|nr:uncharacterized protein LOC106668030 isoform X2 [Cimex lectularius]